jgi:hypothetical protein
MPLDSLASSIMAGLIVSEFTLLSVFFGEDTNIFFPAKKIASLG